MNYGEIVKAAFWITLRNRILWFFGFFAGGTSAGANFNTPQATSAVSTTRILEIRGGGCGGMPPALDLDPGQWI